MPNGEVAAQHTQLDTAGLRYVSV